MRVLAIPAIATTVILLCAGGAYGQARKSSSKGLPPSAYKLVAITVTGTHRYQPEDVARSTGLQLGQTVHDEDFKDAVRLLGETGAFTDVSYNFQFDPDGTKLDLQVQETEKVVPARFDNVVWFSDHELLEKLHARVPLIDRQIPLNGDLVNQVSEALQILLIEKNVAGQVDYLRVSPSDNGPVEAIAFTVIGPHITIRNVGFSGADPGELTLLAAAAERLQGAVFLRPALRTQVEKAFMPIYLARGYLQAAFGEPEAKVVENGPQETVVDLTFAVTPGRQYKVAETQVLGSKALSPDRLKALLHLQPGQTANAIQLEKDTAAIRQLYSTLGYMAVEIKTEPTMDDAQAVVTFVVRIVEGDVYKMGELEIQGLDSRATARVQNDWTLRPGDIYDASYPARFLEQAFKEIGDWKTSVHETLNPREQTVDVTIRFDPKA